MTVDYIQHEIFQIKIVKFNYVITEIQLNFRK